MSQARRRRVSPLGVRAAYLTLLVVAFGLGFGLGRRSVGEAGGVDEPMAGVDPVPAAVAPEPAAETHSDAPSGAPVSRGRAATTLVIDDLGRSVATLESLEALGVPVTYAVLPFESRTPEVVAHLALAGLETLCHLPMEALGGVDPGPGALHRSMGAAEIREATRRALDAVPGAVGVNNHMGSAFSADAASMAPFLEVVAERGLFFLDSRTSARTTGVAVANRAGVAVVERNVFLDRDRAPERIRAEFRRALELAGEGEPSVMIGHPYAETLEVLRQEVPRALDLGFTFVTVGDVIGGV